MQKVGFLMIQLIYIPITLRMPQFEGNCPNEAVRFSNWARICDMALIVLEASVAERLSYPLCKPGVPSSIPGFSSLSDETLNRGPVSV